MSRFEVQCPQCSEQIPIGTIGTHVIADHSPKLWLCGDCSEGPMSSDSLVFHCLFATSHDPRLALAQTSAFTSFIAQLKSSLHSNYSKPASPRRPQQGPSYSKQDNVRSIPSGNECYPSPVRRQPECYPEMAAGPEPRSFRQLNNRTDQSGFQDDPINLSSHSHEEPRSPAKSDVFKDSDEISLIFGNMEEAVSQSSEFEYKGLDYMPTYSRKRNPSPLAPVYSERPSNYESEMTNLACLNGCPAVRVDRKNRARNLVWHVLSKSHRRFPDDCLRCRTCYRTSRRFDCRRKECIKTCDSKSLEFTVDKAVVQKAIADDFPWPNSNLKHMVLAETRTFLKIN